MCKEMTEEIAVTIGTATYSPEDNKLRLYADARLSKDIYSRVKAAGFKWAPKQELFVAPMWTPGREDLLIELCGEIDDEDYSPEERSADRAERFEGYRERRRNEAGQFAEKFESGPEAFGHQSQARAERQADRHDRIRGKAVTQWGKAEYWQSRIAGVIRHAMFKSSAAVRRGRILRIEAEMRKMQKNLDQAKESYLAWCKVRDCQDQEEQKKLAHHASNYHSRGFNYQHPRNPERKTSLYSLLSCEIDPITPAEAAALYLEDMEEPGLPGSYYARWLDHYNFRLQYEKALLAEEGGTAAEDDMQPGGFIGSHQIQKVSRSNVTGRVVSVHVLAPDRYDNGKMKLTKINIERLAAGSYRPPTEEEMQIFDISTKARKEAEKASKPKEPPLINPTEEDARRLQAIWNAKGKAKHEANELSKYGKSYNDYKPSEIALVTQAQYSAASKGATKCEVRTIHKDGRLSRRKSNMYSENGRKYDESLPEAVCKVRTAFGAGGGSWFAPDRIIVITDKPQKKIPIDWKEAEKCEAANW